MEGLPHHKFIHPVFRFSVKMQCVSLLNYAWTPPPKKRTAETNIQLSSPLSSKMCSSESAPTCSALRSIHNSCFFIYMQWCLLLCVFGITVFPSRYLMLPLCIGYALYLGFAIACIAIICCVIRLHVELVQKLQQMPGAVAFFVLIVDWLKYDQLNWPQLYQLQVRSQAKAARPSCCPLILQAVFSDLCSPIQLSFLMSVVHFVTFSFLPFQQQ